MSREEFVLYVDGRWVAAFHDPSVAARFAADISVASPETAVEVLTGTDAAQLDPSFVPAAA